MNEAELSNLIQPLDIGFVSGSNRSPGTWFNRQAGAGWRRAFDRSVDTHCFLFTKDLGHPFATEMLPDEGVIKDSAMQYLHSPRDDRLTCIYRWKGFKTHESVVAVLDALAAQRQQQVPYDTVGAILCDPELHWLLPWVRPSSDKYFCSRQVFKMLEWIGWNNAPKEWLDNGPHPYRLRRQFGKDPEFDLVKWFDWR